MGARVPDEQTPSATSSSGCRPGNDIDVSGFEVADIGSTHLLADNKFAAARPHLLLVTQDGYRRQHERLGSHDFAVLCQVLSALRRRERHLANLQLRHRQRMQLAAQALAGLPRPARRRLCAVAGPAHDPATWPALPFKRFIHRFGGEFPSADALTGIYYETLLSQGERAVGYQPDEGGNKAVPHDVVLDRKWILVVPRRNAGLIGVVVNAAAMLGMV
ncbi:hypothetical protein MYCTH_2128775 [Thermothelomyces thermophilus ATCC 42464]|uniref:Uncharacterized protein n=1 Tax=Thermothelomyces thermophilus (strain ATCC 42464 / BCRC 31852 / DSM 1799) TaxID=573729 RepID=G2QJD4_THET4|nr:uncharacterized protein MYCTH_2128775 [Thermothelomyces thermophilus ATCC 42464]AEO59691.1 hypothetical protein MYCTH_2128775 [Thermothelomyces thermophilus ATCC 42464]